MATNKYSIIIGCGRLGARLANNLSNQSWSVVAVDTDPDSFDKLSDAFSGFTIEGDATEMAILRQAKINQADLVVATTRKDTVNLMIAQIADRIYQVPQVIARVFDPQRQEIYNGQDIQTICPTIVAANLFIDTISENMTRENNL